MSNFVGNKPNPLSMLIKGAQKVFGKTQKTTGTGTISSVNVAKNLAKKKTIKDDMIKARDKQLAGVRDEAKIAIKSKNPLSKFTKKAADIVDRNNKAKGGRVGLRFGTKKKSNVDKIKKTFGTLSVRAGIDNNPNPTYADKIAGAKMKNKNKKKVI